MRLGNTSSVRVRHPLMRSARSGALALAAAYVYIVIVALSPAHAWMHPEAFPIKRYIADHVPLEMSAVLRAPFNAAVFEGNASREGGASRLTRPVSSLFEILDTHFRMALWEFVTPHPGLSLTMILTLLLEPLLVFLLARRIGADRDDSLWAASFFLLQPGSLSLVAMLFRPAKALANAVLVLSLWWAARPGPVDRGRFAALWSMLFFAFLCDETAVVAYAAIPLFFRERLFTSRRRILVYAALLPVVAALYVGILPWMATLAGQPRANLGQFEYVAHSHFAHLMPAPAAAAALMDLGLVFGESVGLQNILRVPWWLMPLAVLHLGAFLALLIALRSRLRTDEAVARREQAVVLGRAAAAITMCALLHAFLMQMSADRFTGRIWGPYWYGSYLPVFLAIAFAMTGDIVGARAVRDVFRGTLLAMLMISFPYLNDAYRLHHYHPYAPRLIEDDFSGLRNRYEERGPAIDVAEELRKMHAAAQERGTAAVWTPDKYPQELYGVAVEEGLVPASSPGYVMEGAMGAAPKEEGSPR